MSKTILEELYQTIQDRKTADPAASYTASLLNGGTAKIAQKVGEESIEAIIEALSNNPEKLREESADLLFHLMVLWADQGVTPEEVFATLQQRTKTSGHTEKASRIKEKE